MPEMFFTVRWPDGEARYYSPSLVIEDHLEAGATYPVAEFADRATAALAIASERVAAKFGFACSRAQSAAASIRDRAEAARREPGEGLVTIVAFERIVA